MKAFRPALARALFKAGLSGLGGRVLPEGGVLVLDGGARLPRQWPSRDPAREHESNEPRSHLLLVLRQSPR